MSLSFKNRIAVYNLISAAALIAIVFGVVYSVVRFSVNYDVNHDLDTEIRYHQEFVEKQPINHLMLVEPSEWEESEHNEINVNPVFVQIFDSNGRFYEKSRNLKDETLKFKYGEKETYTEDTFLAGIPVRQVQAPLISDEHIVGYVIIAMSMEQEIRLLDNLSQVLIIAFFTVLLALFFITRFIAGKSIRPAVDIINTTSKITNNNLGERIELPKNKDELFELSTSINQLLDRIEDAVVRERKFTSDASHELRTPLAVIQGTLEVLIRKPRKSAEYEEKIRYCISEVNRLNDLADQLLLLARFENQKAAVQIENVELDEIILQVLERYSSRIAAKDIALSFEFSDHYKICSDAYLVSVILENLISNAVKYTKEKGKIVITLDESDGKISCKIADSGVGIDPEDLQKIYNEFFRAESQRQSIKGTGLGLSIVKRLCILLNAELNIQSDLGKGTTAIVLFKAADYRETI
ncbi:signal transduction histidine kinase [Flavobacterium sp. 28YEA47A]|uniref:sensor histidine kinase n=1 Tax=Flavobacterium sp. 28YEA47A TaxID=3156276 RepID=UPI003511BBEE